MASTSDDAPTVESLKHRLKHADGCYTQSGRSKSERRFVLADDALGRAWMRQKVSDEEYSALRRYASHWLAGGLAGTLHTIDLDRVAGMIQGEAGFERRQDHRDAYVNAKREIGFRPALLADQVACFDVALVVVGTGLLGYRSPWHGYEKAAELLADAGYRLARHWKERDH
jgi:hypothetical protein